MQVNRGSELIIDTIHNYFYIGTKKDGTQLQYLMVASESSSI